MAPSAGIFFVGQLGKYLPGSVWSVLAQAEMGARLDVPRRRSGVVGLVSIGLGVLTGLLVGLPALALLLGSSHAASAAWLLLALPLVVVACWPRALNFLVATGLRVLRREPLEHELSGRAVLVTVLLFIASWLAFGLQTWILARSVGGADGAGSLTLAHAVGLRARRDDRPAGDHRPGRGGGAREPAGLPAGLEHDLVRGVRGGAAVPVRRHRSATCCWPAAAGSTPAATGCCPPTPGRCRCRRRSDHRLG